MRMINQHCTKMPLNLIWFPFRKYERQYCCCVVPSLTKKKRVRELIEFES